MSGKSKRKPVKKDWSSLLSDSAHDVRRMSNVIRFSSIPVTYAESTAEHSFYVALYATMIHRELRGEPCTDPESLRERNVLLHALTHDLGECVAGDVVRTLKYATPGMKREVDRAEDMLVDRLLPERVRSLLEEHVADVKAVVKAADYLSLFHFMRREAARHNLEIYPFYWRMVRDIEAGQKDAPAELAGLYKEMVSEAKAVSRDCFGELSSAEKHRRWYRDI